MKITTLVCVGILAFPSLAIAEMSFKDYKTDKAIGGHRWEEFKIYLLGVGNGIQWTNTELVAKGKQPLFCPPDHLTLRIENLLDILNTTLAKIKWADENPIEPGMLAGLEQTFPCQ
jgi:hypothetical protein